MTQIERQSITEALTCIGWLEETLTCWSWWWTNMSSFSEPTQICLQTFEISTGIQVQHSSKGCPFNPETFPLLFWKYWYYVPVKLDMMPNAGWHHWRRYWRARPASPLELFANRNGKNIAHAAHCLPSTIHSLLMHTWGRIFKVQQQCLLCRSLASSNKSWSTVASVASLFLMETRCCRY